MLSLRAGLRVGLRSARLGTPPITTNGSDQVQRDQPVRYTTSPTITVIMAVAWVIYVFLRRIGDRLGLTPLGLASRSFRACALCYYCVVDRPHDCALEPLMSGVELKANDVKTLTGAKRRSVLSSVRILPFLATAAAVVVAALAGWPAWQYYMGAPWTRDGTVRAYVVKVAPQVAGEIVQLPIADNQFVHKGDLLMLIDPRNYSIAVQQAEAAVEQTRATAENANAEMTRRLKLSDIAVTEEERQTYVSQAATAEATYQSALANLDQARVNFEAHAGPLPGQRLRHQSHRPARGLRQRGALQLSVVNSNSYWVDAYFEETALGRIQEGDAATIKLMGYTPLLRGRVQGLARGIDVPNATPDASGLASVNPIFTFVRLAQRVPVRIRIDEVPPGVNLVAGLTATVQVEPTRRLRSGSKPGSANVSKAGPSRASSRPCSVAASSGGGKRSFACPHGGHTSSPPAQAAVRQRRTKRLNRRLSHRRRRQPRSNRTHRNRRRHPLMNCRSPPRPPRRPRPPQPRLPPISRRSKNRSPPTRLPATPPRRLQPIAQAPAAPTSCRQANTSDRPSTFSVIKTLPPSRRIDLPIRSAGAPAPSRCTTGTNSRLRADMV